jgi:hypothetical protein
MKFLALFIKEPILKKVIYDIFQYGTAYVVGGYFRDFLNNKDSRDVDIIVDIKDIKLIDIIQRTGCKYYQNRHKGIKLDLGGITVDLWSLENNWAFKNGLVKLNDNDKLKSIAKGCFFNYDALVINLKDYKYNAEFYLDFQNNGILDILQKTNRYKNLNPTPEANIVRAFYIKEKYNIKFSENLIKYIVLKTIALTDRYKDGLLRILNVKENYEKYQDLDNVKLIRDIIFLVDESKKTTNKLFLDL